MDVVPSFEEEMILLNWMIVLPLAVLIMVPAVLSAWITLRRWVPRWAVVGVTLFIAAMLFLMLSIELRVRINEEGISYQYFPIHWNPHLIRWEEIEFAYCRVHYAGVEYGSWGIAGEENDRAYTMPGVFGIQIVLHNGNRVLISISETKPVQEVLKYYLYKKKERPTPSTVTKIFKI